MLLNVSLLSGWIKGQSKYTTEKYPQKKDTTEMYPGKVMHIIGE